MTNPEDNGTVDLPIKTATFRFYAELNDFLPRERRQRPFRHRFRGSPAVKDVIEALGVPHTEVDLILINGSSSNFETPLDDGDYVAVYPVFESLDISSLTQVRQHPLRQTRFILDVHLGRLARLLRLLGFDTRYCNTYTDPEIVAIARREHRIILTRDTNLLKRRTVTHGYWVRATDPIDQAREVLQRFDLREQVLPFSRCLRCNGRLQPVDKEEILSRLPPHVAAHHDEFLICEGCHRVYWRGSHLRRLQAQIDRILQ